MEKTLERGKVLPKNSPDKPIIKHDSKKSFGLNGLYTNTVNLLSEKKNAAKLKYLGKLLHPGKQTWNLKMMVLKGISSSMGSFSGSMLVMLGFWGVYFLNLNDQGIWGTFPLLFTTIWG